MRYLCHTLGIFKGQTFCYALFVSHTRHIQGTDILLCVICVTHSAYSRDRHFAMRYLCHTLGIFKGQTFCYALFVSHTRHIQGTDILLCVICVTYSAYSRDRHFAMRYLCHILGSIFNGQTFCYPLFESHTRHIQGTDILLCVICVTHSAYSKDRHFAMRYLCHTLGIINGQTFCYALFVSHTRHIKGTDILLCVICVTHSAYSRDKHFAMLVSHTRHIQRKDILLCVICVTHSAYSTDRHFAMSYLCHTLRIFKGQTFCYALFVSHTRHIQRTDILLCVICVTHSAYSRDRHFAMRYLCHTLGIFNGQLTFCYALFVSHTRHIQRTADVLLRVICVRH